MRRVKRLDNFGREYKKTFDNIHAGDDLRKRVKELRPQKRAVTPFKATLGTIAAAVMIFAVVHDYTFDRDTTGVIYEVATSVPTIAENTEFAPVKTEAVATPIPKTKAATNTVKPATVTKSPQAPTVQNVPDTKPEPMTEADNTDIPVAASYIDDRVKSPTEISVWSLSEYISYIGKDFVSAITGSFDAQYTGPDELDFELDKDGVPYDDIAVFTFNTAHGGHIRLTVSKSALFENALSGTTAEAGSGFNAYALCGDVYYSIYTTGMTQEETDTVIRCLN